MLSYDRLLVPIDGSDSSYAAARKALSLAAETGAAVDVVHVVDPGHAPSVVRQSTEALREQGRTMLATVEELAEEIGPEVDTALLEGAPYEAILDYADERGTQLVVMGRRGSGTATARLIGGVTEKVLRAGCLPTLTVRTADDALPSVVSAERVLLPTDGSDCAEIAGEHAASMAALAGATIHVVSVADVQAAGGLFDAGGVNEEFVRNVEAQGEAAVDRLAAAVRAATDRHVDTAVVRGRPADALRDYVEAHDVGLVVMGAHGRSGFERWMLGSVTERLLRIVDVPILVVPGAP